VLLARALGNVPPLADVRSALAENLYEEQCGGISKMAPHPELFLRMMEGLGYSRGDFEEDDASLHPAALTYKNELRVRASAEPWQAAVALLTIFVEGSVNERAELEGTFVRARGEDAVRNHALVVHYGCPPSAMDLTRAHAMVEGGHRGDAWRMVLAHSSEERADEEGAPDGGALAEAIVTTCEEARRSWLRYRDGVAERMGLTPSRAT
jgi:hypothetical protein